MSEHHEQAQDTPRGTAVPTGEPRSGWRNQQRHHLQTLVEAVEHASGREARRAAFDAITRDLLRIAREDPELFIDLWRIGGADETARQEAEGNEDGIA